jgi:hypothetical protein
VLVDVTLVLDQLVLNHRLQIGARCAQLRQTVDHVLYPMKAGQVVLNPHVEGRGDGARLFVTTDVQVAIRPAVRQAVNKPRISVKSKNDVLVLREERVVIRIVQPVGMLAVRTLGQLSTVPAT